VHRGPANPEEPRPDDGVAFTSAVAQRSRRTPAAVVIGAVAVLAIALLTSQTAPVVNKPIGSVTPRGSSDVAVVASSLPGTVVVEDPSPIPGPPSLDPTVTPHPTFVSGPAKAGLTVFDPVGASPIFLTISLPGGWRTAGTGMFVKGGGIAPTGMSIGAWSIKDVYLYPCRWASGVVADSGLMATAEGQAEALADWWGQDPKMPPTSNSPIAPNATRPTLTTIAGYPASYVEVLILTKFDFGQCDGHQLVLWDTAGGGIRYGLGPGELHRLWVVDVYDTVIVLDAAFYRTTSAADQAQLQTMIDSVAIAPGT
jgi:hypothetical protein